MRAPLAVAAAARVLAYARATQVAASLPVSRLELFSRADHLVIDEQARAHLELCETMLDRRREGSLLAAIDVTRSSLGARLLRRWLLFPLVDVAPIRRRQDAIERLHARPSGAGVGAQGAGRDRRHRAAGQTRAAGGGDAARPGRSGPILGRLPELEEALRAATEDLPVTRPAEDLLSLGADLAADLAVRLGTTLADDAPAATKEGGLVRDGFSAELDRLRQVAGRRSRSDRRHRDARTRAHRDPVAEGQIQQRVWLLHRDHARARWSRSPATTCASRRSPMPSGSSPPSCPITRAPSARGRAADRAGMPAVRGAAHRGRAGGGAAAEAGGAGGGGRRAGGPGRGGASQRLRSPAGRRQRGDRLDRRPPPGGRASGRRWRLRAQRSAPRRRFRADPAGDRAQHGGQVDRDPADGADGDPGPDGQLRAGQTRAHRAVRSRVHPRGRRATTWRAGSPPSWSR